MSIRNIIFNGGNINNKSLNLYANSITGNKIAVNKIEVKTADDNHIDYSTPDLGQPNYTLHTDGSGNTFWATSGASTPPTLQTVYDNSLPPGSQIAVISNTAPIIQLDKTDAGGNHGIVLKNPANQAVMTLSSSSDNANLSSGVPGKSVVINSNNTAVEMKGAAGVGSLNPITGSAVDLGVISTNEFQNGYFSGQVHSASIYLTGVNTIFENGVILPKIWTEDNGNSTNSTSVGKTAGNIGVVTGSSNTSIGERALEKITTGGQNTAMGNLSMFNLTTGSGNMAVGQNTMPFVTSGRFNTCVGGSAGQNLTTGENNVCLGYNTRTGTGNALNRIMIGKDAQGTTDNEAVIGNTSLTSIRAGGSNCDLGTAAVPYKNAYLNGTVNSNAIGAQFGGFSGSLSVGSKNVGDTLQNMTAIAGVTEFAGVTELAGILKVDTIVPLSTTPVTVNSDLVVTAAVTVGGVLQDTAADVFGQVSSGLGSFSIPLIATYKFLNSTTAPGLICNTLLFGDITHTANAYQLNVTDAGVYQLNANISTKPSSDNALVHFTLFTRLGGVDTETEFQSVAEKLNGRFSNQTISALIQLQAGESVLLAMKSVNAIQTSVIQFLSMNIVRIKTSIYAINNVLQGLSNKLISTSEKSYSYNSTEATVIKADQGSPISNPTDVGLGWYFTNSGATKPNNKINWYFVGGDNNKRLLGDLFSITARIKIYNNTSLQDLPFITTYTKPQGVGDASGWYRSRQNWVFTSPQQASITAPSTILMVRGIDPSDIDKDILHYNLVKDGSTSIGLQADDEEILFITLSSDSGATLNSVKFALEKFTSSFSGNTEVINTNG